MEDSSVSSSLGLGSVDGGCVGAPLECRITAKQWNAVAVWSWNAQMDTCPICKGPVADMCIECRGNAGSARRQNAVSQNYNNDEDENRSNKRSEFGTSKVQQPLSSSSCSDNAADECLVVWGACGHVFHHHCISRWAQQRPLCPICGCKWAVSKTAKNDY
ncbi:hypothetical protein, conserved [Trypanosoma brucei gambiense DAL972]|uniref:RING-type domain-containing protein n=1 Tax=Trypanosoma brucei gambiense (strain MHOM/CI/86/DAL972) TaxID=679716 RepID=C9ZPQ2_TRYB9|nr:hypothetical protein, conserved [Trypanosoma brucei gambiense DAL972]CBH11380.1 hypothetical protein, conserved [Trypanosoma brucei gambiense DAL972]|eukprot:XP_011773667.1 hypothetical protein, conserved [Trypanosoma brucei gambiense DAL972]